MSFFGASMHFMDDGIDTGKIIYQEKVDLTEDINLSMLYYMSFRLERDVFKHGFNYYLLNKNLLFNISVASYILIVLPRIFKVAPWLEIPKDFIFEIIVLLLSFKSMICIALSLLKNEPFVFGYSGIEFLFSK